MLNFIKDKKTYFFLLLLLSIGIGLQIILYKIIIIALLLQWLLSVDYNKKLINLKNNTLTIGLIAFYLLYTVSYFWSDNKDVALYEIIFKSPLLILPLVVLSNYQLSSKKINYIFLSFAFSNLLLNLICLIDAYAVFLKTGIIDEFYYGNFTINMHSAYQSMFTCFSIAVFVYLFVKEKIISKQLSYIVVTIQILFILLLSSRMQILIMIVIIPTYLISYYYKRKNILLGLLYTILIFGFSYLIISAPSTLKHRYTQTISNINIIGLENNSTNARKFIWSEGLELIKKNWLVGAGAGDVKNLLVSRYEELILENPTHLHLVDSTKTQIEKNTNVIAYLRQKALNDSINFDIMLRDYATEILVAKNNHYKEAFARMYNFHNQYLGTFGTVGIVGLLLLLYFLITPIIISIKKRYYLAITFFFIVGASFLTESMLERQAGVSFFAFFYVLFISRINQSKPF